MSGKHDCAEIRRGNHGGGPTVSIGQNGELAEAIAGAHHADALSVLDDIRVPFLEHHELVARIALEDDDLTCLGSDFVRRPGELTSPPE
jgi:hypothetical protein